MTKALRKYQLIIFFILAGYTCIGQSSLGNKVVVLEEKDEPDNISYLMAGAAVKSGGLKFVEMPPPHFGWIDSLDKTDEYFKWQVQSNSTSAFHIEVLMNAREGEAFTISSEENPHQQVSFNALIDGWDKIDAGIIHLSKGINTLVLKKNAGTGNSAALRSIEIIKEANRENYFKRIQQFKKDPSWLSAAGYGLMIEYGPWTYPSKGERVKTPEQLARNFNVPEFVKMVEETGASYVLWSLTWYSYHMLTPCRAVDSIIGNSNRTTTTDLIGKIADSLHAHGIKFMLYYHCGQDGHVGHKSTDWWARQDWPDEFSKTGTGNKDVFVRNWCRVIGELGNRLGKSLSGWFFDDGAACYYPVPFEKMGAVAKEGNSDRLISYNDWVWPRVTEFQEISFGENHTGNPHNKIISEKADGIFRGGPNKGLLEQGMFMMEQDWGVYKPNQPIITKITADSAKALVIAASTRGVPLSFNIMMWADGTVAPSSLDILRELKKERLNNVRDKDNLKYSQNGKINK